MKLIHIASVLFLATAAHAAEPATFTSVGAGGNWSDPATWTVDGKPATQAPAEGDLVTIQGKVTLDAPVSVGTGQGDAITLAPAAKLGDNALTLAAPLTARGSIRFNGQSLIEVQGGAGIEFDAAAANTPAIHATFGSAINLCLRGSKDKRCFLRVKKGTAGNPARIIPDANYVPVNLGATYTDFADFSDPKAFGIVLAPGKQPALAALRDCTFTRCTLSYSDGNCKDTFFTFENIVFNDSPLVPAGVEKYGARFAGNFNFDLLRAGFDGYVWLDQPREVKSTVFAAMVFFYPYHPKAFETWTDNLVVIVEPSDHYFQPRPGVYTRTYILCRSDVNNAHVVGAAGPIVFDRCLWDVPLTKGYIDDSLMNSGEITVRRCIVLPRVGGQYPNTGCNIGYVMGGPIKYEFNTIALGHECAVHSDPSHRGQSGEIVSFKYNLFYVLDGVKDDKGHDAAGRVFMTFGGLKDPVKPEDCDYNNLFRSNYGQIEITAGGKLGEHDLAVDPKFVDPTRNLTTFYRTQAGIKAGAPELDVAGAIDFLRTHPERMPEMIDWTRAGYIPTSPALKAVPDASGPTQGWIGAEPGRP